MIRHVKGLCLFRRIRAAALDLARVHPCKMQISFSCACVTQPFDFKRERNHYAWPRHPAVGLSLSDMIDFACRCHNRIYITYHTESAVFRCRRSQVLAKCPCTMFRLHLSSSADVHRHGQRGKCPAHPEFVSGQIAFFPVAGGAHWPKVADVT